MTPNKPTTLREEFRKYYESFPSGDASTGYPDVEQLTDWWLDKFSTHSTELVSKIEGMKKQEWLGGGNMILPAPGNMQYNQAIDQVISLINQEK